MPTKFQSATGEISPTPTAEHKFPVYLCEDCGAPNAAFGLVRADGRLSYCGWAGRPICVGKGRAEDSGKVVPVAAAPW